jgi:hypothetical protein
MFLKIYFYQGPQRCVELFCEIEAEKKELFDTVWVIFFK